MSHLSSLGLLGVHQRDAPLDAREQFAAGVASQVGPDLVVLSTCHRVECYFAIPPSVDARAWMGERVLGLDDGLRGAQVLTGEAAVRHLFRAAMGLDSVVRGEGQILSQLRDTYDRARACFELDPLLSEVIQHALHLAREVRAATSFGTVGRSVGSLAVDALVRLLPQPSTASVLVIGAGEIGRLAARALVSRVGAVRIANRDPDRARELAVAIGAEGGGQELLDRALDEADAVVSAADTRGTWLTVERLARRLARGPLAIVDIAVPRSVDVPARVLPGLTYRSVDDLVSAGSGPLEADVAFADRRCVEEARRFLLRRFAREASPTIHALRTHAGAIRDAQLRRALAKLSHLDSRDRRVVEGLASALTGALLHRPFVALRSDPTREQAARTLFGLERS
jgi:glutamyl-tRNA reductase